MFTTLYLTTTDPNIPLSQWFTTEIVISILASILFHSFIYTLFLNLVSFLFLHRLLPQETNTKLFLILIPFMFFGFIARYFHVQDVHNAYHQNMEKTRKHLDQLYISWLFIS